MIARRTSLLGLAGPLALLAACGGGGGGSTGAGSSEAGETAGGSFPGTTGAPPTSGDTSGAPTSGGPSTGEGSSSGATSGAPSTGTSGAPGTSGEAGEASTGGSSTGEASTGEASTGATSTGSTEAGSSSEGGSTGEADTGSTDAPVGVCGDGVVDMGEACDDGDDVDDDECSNACALPSCGDGQQNGGETGVDCGGPCPACPFALLLAGNASKSVAARFDGASWTSSDVSAPTVDGVGLTISNDGTGFGALRYTKIGDPKDNQLQYVTWKAGVWSAPKQVGADTTRAAPTIAAVGNGAQLVFQGEDYQYYYAVYDGATWSPAAEMVGSFGPGPGALASLGFDAWLVYHDGASSNHLTAQRRTGAWFGKLPIDGDPQMFDLQPAIAATAADKALVVHARNAGGQLRWSAGPVMWSAPADVAGAQTSSPPALAGLGGGAAALAFRGTDGKVYVADFDGVKWAAPKGVAAPNPSIYGPPALARGIGGAELELLYVDGGTKTIRHTRRVAGVWSAAVQVGNTAVERAALATRP